MTPKVYTYEGPDGLIELVESGEPGRHILEGEYYLDCGELKRWDKPWKSFFKYKILIPKEKAMTTSIGIRIPFNCDNLTLDEIIAKLQQLREDLKPKEKEAKIGDWLKFSINGNFEKIIKWEGGILAWETGRKNFEIITDPTLIAMLEKEYAQ